MFICSEARKQENAQIIGEKYWIEQKKKWVEHKVKNLFLPPLLENSFNENQTEKWKCLQAESKILSYHSLQPTNRLENRRRWIIIPHQQAVLRHAAP